MWSGMESAHPKVDGTTVFHTWISSIYHTPKDYMSQQSYFGIPPRNRPDLSPQVAYHGRQVRSCGSQLQGGKIGLAVGSRIPGCPIRASDAGQQRPGPPHQASRTRD